MSTENEMMVKINKKKPIDSAKSVQEDESENNSDDEHDEEEGERKKFAGCCVCGDDSGFANNLLVYCDGIDCQVAVHQCCYGILNVPEDNWYCGSCKHKIELASNALKTKSTNVDTEALNLEFKRIKCDLCPWEGGALKRTQNQKWAHVVCALYIPEIVFGNVKTMEPVILKDIKTERFNKKCSICERGESEQSGSGVYVNCNKQGCKHWFHVTCAQTKGLLCEENKIKNNLTYSIYCKLHLKKMAQTDSIKTLPAFNLSLCTQSDETNTNNIPNNVNELISCINKSLKNNQIPNDLNSLVSIKDKLESFVIKKPKIEIKEKKKTITKFKDNVVEFSEKKKKRFSFNNPTSVKPAKILKEVSIIKTKSSEEKKSTIDKPIENTETKNFHQIDPSSNYDNIKPVKKSNIQELKTNELIIKSNDLEKTTTISETKNIEKKPKTETKEEEKNDDNISIKSFHSTSTNNSLSKRKSSDNSKQNQNNNKKAKYVRNHQQKSDAESDDDINHNNNLSLNLNIDETKINCPGIVTPSTSSCASSTTSNFPKSPESLENKNQPKSKIRNLIQKPVNKEPECIDAFGNYINKSAQPIRNEKENHVPDSLEELLNEQWSLGSALINESTKKFDCIDLLNLLYKCKQENLELEEKIKLLEKNNTECLKMNKKLSKQFEFNSNEVVETKSADQTSTSKTQTNQANNLKTSLSFNKVINDQIQNHIITNASSYQPSPSSLNYSSLIQNYLPSLSNPNTSPSQNNSFLNLYQKHMLSQSPNGFNKNPNLFQPQSSSLPPTPTKTNPIQTLNTNLTSLLNQNQFAQWYQQSIQQQQQMAFCMTGNAGSQTTSNTNTGFNH